MQPIKLTNVHESEFLENATELSLDAKLHNSEHKEFQHTTEGFPKTNKGSFKLEN